MLSCIASTDVARVLLGGDPADFQSKARKDYRRALLSTLRHAELEPLRVRIEERFLAFALRDEGMSASAAWLLSSFSEDSEPRLGLFEFLDKLSAATLPDSDLLRHLLLEAYALAPHLKAFAAVPLLRSAAAEVVHSPEIALRWRLHDNSLTVTRLARAMHEAHQSGLRADQILDILNSTGIS
jgi:hypothetical protein